MFSKDPLRGMEDFYPEDVRVYRWMEAKIEAVAQGYSYEAFEAPLLEPIEIYAAKSSEELVNEQSFIVEKKKDAKLILRPELTPSLARMVARRYIELEKPIRWYSNPTCYRYERPQRGRKREFKQFNVDVLGEDALVAEAEVLTVVVDIMESFGARPSQYQVLYNNRRLVDAILTRVLDIPAARVPHVYKILDKREKLSEGDYRAYIREYFQDARVEEGLLQFNEFDALDDLPFYDVPADFDQERGYREIVALQDMLAEIGIADACTFSPGVIRGLDYYTGTVFEVFDTGEENRRALFGGGRYDDLISMFSDQPLSGVGFGMGLYTLKLFLETYDLIPETVADRDWSRVVFVLPMEASFQARGLRLARALRRQTGYDVRASFSTSKIGKQLGNAAKKGARLALILGKREVENDTISVKNLVKNEQVTVPVAELVDVVRREIETLE